MTYTTSLRMGNKHQEMNKILDFYEKDIEFLKTLLTEVLSKNNGFEVRAEAEHFQNQFIIQQNNIEELRKKVLLNKQEASVEAKSHAGKVDERLIVDIITTEKEVDRIEIIITGIRKEFKRFVANWF